MRLFLHLCTSSQTLLTQVGVMELAHFYGHMRDVVVPADVIGFKAVGANLPRRARLLAGAAKNRFGRVSDHPSGPTLAYKFSIFKTSASAISRIADTSA